MFVCKWNYVSGKQPWAPDVRGVVSSDVGNICMAACYGPQQNIGKPPEFYPRNGNPDASNGHIWILYTHCSTSIGHVLIIRRVWIHLHMCNSLLRLWVCGWMMCVCKLYWCSGKQAWAPDVRGRVSSDVGNICRAACNGLPQNIGKPPECEPRNWHPHDSNGHI